MCMQCGIYRVRAIWDNRVQFRYVGHMRVKVGFAYRNMMWQPYGYNVRNAISCRMCHSCVGNV
jgi:hypothetical protein